MFAASSLELVLKETRDRLLLGWWRDRSIAKSRKALSENTWIDGDEERALAIVLRLLWQADGACVAFAFFVDLVFAGSLNGGAEDDAGINGGA